MSTTHVLVRDVDLPTATSLRGGGTMALITLDDGADHRRPTTLSQETVAELTGVLAVLRERAAAGEIQAVGVTGKPYFFVAGADLKQIGTVTTRAQALALGQHGHAAYGALADLGVPTFAFVNGVALGGGLELALACEYRTASATAGAIGLPETSLGLIPGWGGASVLPRLIGVEAALEVMLTRAMAGKPLSAAEAVQVGIVDVVLEPADFLAQSVAWAASVMRGEVAVTRPEADPDATFAAVTAAAQTRLDAVVGASRPAPGRCLEVVRATRGLPLREAYAVEDEVLADLAMTDEMRASVYAFGLVSGAKRPADAPSADLARPIARVGIIGAGLMAAQIAVLVARRLKVPVVMRDLDEARAQAGLAHAAEQVERSVQRGRITAEQARATLGLIGASTELADLAGCDLVIEAVTEVLAVKQAVFAEVEPLLAPEAILATNTSALSVTAMAAGLAHPERVVGLHFFNPVAAMPLVEVIRAERTDEATLATGYAVAKALGKSAVGSLDRPGFIVNRLLVLLLGRILGAVERGTPVVVADRALDALGLPMPPFQLLDLVGGAVGLHVLQTLRAELGEAFPASPGLERVVAQQVAMVGEAAPGMPRRVLPELQTTFDDARAPGIVLAPMTEAEVLDDVLTALTREIGLMLEEGVASSASQIDTAMILGAGWPFHLGGITPYLDRTGYSERLLGRRFLPDGVANVLGG